MFGLETVLGGLFGGLFRMAPELLKWFDRKDERKHEKEMFGLQLDADRLRGQWEVDKMHIQSDMTLGAAELEGLIEATKAQARPTGIKWVDAISSLMRPLITFWWVIVMYSVALVCQFIYLKNNGADNVGAVLMLWGSDEKAIVSGIISFWFMDRHYKTAK